MSHPMRRKNQALPQSECDAILTRGTSGVLALSGDDGPYAVPLSYVYDQAKQAIYFHCATAGRKLTAIAQEPRASFCVIDQDEVVPERFTTHYRSIIAAGRVRVLEDPAEKLPALRLLMERYAPDVPAEIHRKEIDGGFDRLLMLELRIEELTGKEARELSQARQKEGEVQQG